MKSEDRNVKVNVNVSGKWERARDFSGTSKPTVLTSPSIQLHETK